MVAVPLPPPVQRHQQHVRPGQLGQGGGGSGQVQRRLAQRSGHPVQDCGPGQELPLLAGDPRQQLRLHVLAHEPVGAAEGDRRVRQRAAFPQGQRRQVQPGRPPLGALVQGGQVFLAQRHLRGAQQHGRLLASQRQVRRADLGDPAFRAQPRDPCRRGIPPSEHQAATGRHMIGQHRQRGPALPVV